MEWQSSRDGVPEGYVQSTVYDEAGTRVATVFESEEYVPLITAAPELLAALRRVLDAGVGHDGRWPSAAEQARLAIAKARGQ